MNIKLDNLVTEKKRIADQPGLFFSARLTLVQGTEGVASRPIFATVAGEKVGAIYTDTGSRIRSHKMLQAISDAMLEIRS
tara:strand:+ start:283 stop:522 length:240 start_codon:yes stop_codon:yes gene_type:complete